MNTDLELTRIFLAQLATQMERCRRTHKRYMLDGKKYLYAKILMRSNVEIRDSIISQAYLLPEQHHAEALDLLEHIDIWIELWNDHSKQRDFDSQDPFIFENPTPFPHKSAESLMRYLSEIKDA